MGGKPSPGTKKDKRLSANKGKKGVNPFAKKSTTKKKALPFGGKKAAPFKKKGK